MLRLELKASQHRSESPISRGTEGGRKGGSGQSCVVSCEPMGSILVSYIHCDYIKGQLSQESWRKDDRAASNPRARNEVRVTTVYQATNTTFKQ